MEPNGRALPVDSWVDFLCPYSFITCLELRCLRREIPLDIRWRSILTHPPGMPPPTESMLASFRGARAEAAERARSELCLELKPGPLEIDTLPAHLAFKHAERSGFGDRCHLFIMNAYWLEQARIDRREVLEAIVCRASGDGASVPWDDPSLADSIDADIGLAQTLALYFVPAVRFGGRTIVAGAESYEHLRAAARLACEETTHPGGHTDVQQPPPAGLGLPA